MGSMAGLRGVSAAAGAEPLGEELNCSTIWRRNTSVWLACRRRRSTTEVAGGRDMVELLRVAGPEAVHAGQAQVRQKLVLRPGRCPAPGSPGCRPAGRRHGPCAGVPPRPARERPARNCLQLELVPLGVVHAPPQAARRAYARSEPSTSCRPVVRPAVVFVGCKLVCAPGDEQGRAGLSRAAGGAAASSCRARRAGRLLAIHLRDPGTAAEQQGAVTRRISARNRSRTAPACRSPAPGVAMQIAIRTGAYNSNWWAVGRRMS